MKKVWILSLIIAVFLTGCGKSSEVRYLEDKWKKPNPKTGENYYLVFKSNGTMKHFPEGNMKYQYKIDYDYKVEPTSDKNVFIVKRIMPNVTVESRFRKIDENTMKRIYVKFVGPHAHNEEFVNDTYYRVDHKQWWNPFD